MISATNLSMRFGGKILFKNASFQLNPGNHYGLIGANGAGKSTLLKILARDLTAEEGEFCIPSQLALGTLKQNHFLYEQVPILDTVLMGNAKLWKALEEKNILLDKPEFDEEECHLLADLEKIIEEQDGYSAESVAGKILEGLGLPDRIHHQNLSTLSGGYKLRVLLAQVLFSKPDILLLDEPTNHLDLYSIKWLEGYLRDFPGTLLVSSHDRDFLNAICDHMLDLDHQKITSYKGNYEDFLKTKASAVEQKELAFAKQEKRREDLQNFIDRFKAKASKARQAQSKMKLVDKIEDEMAELDFTPTSRLYPRLKFEPHRSSGALVLKAKGICKSYGTKQVLHQVSFEVERGERIALVGANGIGKSTLLEILTGQLKCEQGSWEWGHAAQVAYFPQDHHREVNGNISLLEWLSEQDPQIPEQKLREILGRVLFTGDDVKKSVHLLSGGETARLILAKMMLLKGNVLIFDEPTNHLDMEAIEALLEALNHYTGTILFVSHNRHFVTHLAKKVIEISDTGVQTYDCSYVEYIEKREMDLLSKNLKPVKIKADEKLAEKPSYQDQKNLRSQKSQQEKIAAQVEKKCQQLEEQIKDLDERMAAADFYLHTPKEGIQRFIAQKEKLEKQFEEALKAWEEAASSV
ncbi:ABC-F family ATP-binding cassette domain-containing protein [Neochlamydia sp. AcF95]|uniref:ABC-F family ATP-binding cassette domain-containing protein n=1 Tax=Neochlamydia sp. AcF95 TaxID=2795734 RepID=UPI001BCA57C7|nr:ABC-F family ATP-binding cassette domain-containing protein [Neochlamydia sp. AcF95]